MNRAAPLLPLVALAALAAALGHAALAQAAGYVYVAEYAIYTPQGAPLGAGRIVYPLGGSPSVVYAAGVAASPESVAALIDGVAEGRYEPSQPVPDLKPLFPVVAYTIPGTSLPAVCSLEETPVTGLTVRTLGGGVARGNAWIAPGASVPMAGSLVGETRGGAVFRVDFYLSQAPEVVCGVKGSPLAAALVGLLSGAALLGGAAVLASRLIRGSLSGFHPV